MAFDEHRPFKSCIFCGSTARRTKEHIFGKAVARRYPVKYRWKSAGNTHFGPVLAQGGGPIISVTAKAACRDCNTGFLKRELDEALEPLMSLIEGKSHQIAAQERAALFRYWERVGLIVDVLTSNYQITATYASGDEYKVSKEGRQAPPIYSDRQRKEWKAPGGKLLDMHIYIGFHDGFLGLNPFTNPASERVMWAESQGGITVEKRLTLEKRFLMTIGKLSVCVWMGKNHFHVPILLRPPVGYAPPIPTSFRDLAAVANQNWDWPGAVPPVSYVDFFGLYGQTPDVKLAIQRLRDPKFRQEFEDFIRRTPPDIR